MTAAPAAAAEAAPPPWQERAWRAVQAPAALAFAIVALAVCAGFLVKPASVAALPPAKDMQIARFCQNVEPPECNVSKDFPLVGQDRYVRALLEYVCEKPKSAFLVWGAMSTGKTAGLRCAMDRWRAQGRLVVNVDLKVNPLGRFPINYTIQEALLQALWSVNASEWDLGVDVSRALEAKLLNISAVEGKVKEQVPAWASQYVSGLPAILARLAFVPANSFAEWVNRRLPQFLAQTPQELSVRLLSFVAMYRPEWAPIFVIQEAQALGNEDLEKLMESVYGHKAGESRLHVVVETSDFLWAQHQRMIKAAESYEPVQVEAASKEDAKRQLIPRIWTEEELERVWAAFGGHGGSLSVVHRKARVWGLEKAIKDHSDYWYGLVGARLSNAGMTLVEPFLVKLRAANFSLTVKEPTEDPAAAALLKHNVLFLVKKTLLPQHMAIQRAIEWHLDTFPLPGDTRQ